MSLVQRDAKMKILGRKLFIGLITVLVIVGLILLGIVNHRYRTAVKYMESGEYQKAFLAFEELGGYRKSKEYLEEVKPYYTQETMSNVDVGDTFFYGMYEQDQSLKNGADPVEWLVLEKQGDNVLIISAEGLDCQPYNTTQDDVTWADSYIRNWLNTTFLNACFTEEEQQRILPTNVTADANPTYETDPGVDTVDRIFFLSIPEAEKYFESKEDRLCYATKYAEVRRGAPVSRSNGYTWWWLRSPGFVGYYAGVIDSSGAVCTGAYSAYYLSGSVRPVLWLNTGILD